MPQYYRVGMEALHLAKTTSAILCCSVVVANSARIYRLVACAQCCWRTGVCNTCRAYIIHTAYRDGDITHVLCKDCNVLCKDCKGLYGLWCRCSVYFLNFSITRLLVLKCAFLIICIKHARTQYLLSPYAQSVSFNVTLLW